VGSGNKNIKSVFEEGFIAWEKKKKKKNIVIIIIHKFEKYLKKIFFFCVLFIYNLK